MNYKCVATVSWEFNSDLSHKEAMELAHKHLGELPNLDGTKDLRYVLRLDILKEKVEKVILGEFKIEDVIPYITKDDERREYEFEGVKHLVRMNSHRYFLFRECMSCVICGLKGTRMFLECHPADQSPHFNLYGEKDEELILLTKDHIHAKSFGGEDRHSNYQVMCIICNNLKGPSNLTIEGVQKIRQIFDENKDKVTKRKLTSLIEDTRKSLEQPWPSTKVTASQRRKKLSATKASSDAVITTCDINIYKKESEVCGKSVYEPLIEGYSHIGCIRKGSYLEPLVATREKVMCKMFDDDVIVLHHSLIKTKE